MAQLNITLSDEVLKELMLGNRDNAVRQLLEEVFNAVLKAEVTEQMGGTYTQVGHYMLPNLTIHEEEQKPIGIWGQRHARYLKQNHKVLYMNLLTSGKLNNYLSDIDKQAEDMFIRLVKEMAEKQGITERLKTADQMAWTRKMNAIRNSAMEIINQDIIFVR